MKNKYFVAIIAFAVLPALSHTQTYRGHSGQPRQRVLPTQRVPQRPLNPRPPAIHRPPSHNIGRPPRPAYHPPHPSYRPPRPIYFNPYHQRYWFHHPHVYNWGANWIPIGTIVSTIAAATVATAIAENATPQAQPIYYNDGVFYQQNTDGYITITPPIGYAVPGIPQNSVMLTYNNNTYYYYNGTFYQKQNNAYIIVSPPIGCIVYNLPSDVQEINNNGLIYYYYNGTYYQPINDNNTPAYQIIQ